MTTLPPWPPFGGFQTCITTCDKGVPNVKHLLNCFELHQSCPHPNPTVCVPPKYEVDLPTSKCTLTSLVVAHDSCTERRTLCTTSLFYHCVVIPFIVLELLSPPIPTGNQNRGEIYPISNNFLSGLPCPKHKWRYFMHGHIHSERFEGPINVLYSDSTFVVSSLNYWTINRTEHTCILPCKLYFFLFWYCIKIGLKYIFEKKMQL